MSIDWRTLPSLTALRAFEATARHGSFAEAARALNVTHAAVAQQVRALETDLGQSLAVRQGRKVALTEAGDRLARTLTSAFQDIAKDVDLLRDGAHSRGLRVTCSPSIAERRIMPNLKSFWDRHPGAEISLTPTRAYLDIVRDGFHVAIRTFHSDVQRNAAPGLETRHLKRVQGTCIVAPDLAARRGTDPHGLPWLWHEEMDLKLALMQSCGLEVDRLEQVPIGSPNLLLQAVRGGMGATLFTETLARDEIDSGRVMEIALPRQPLVDYIGVMPKDPPHPLAEPFLDWARSLL